MMEQTLAHLAELVGFDTQNPPRYISRDGLFAYAADQLNGFDVTIRDYGAGCVSLLAVRGDTDTLYNVHMDTVPATPYWQRDPLALTLEDGRAYGLGACDIKGAAACLLTVAAHTQAPMALLLTSDEEAGDNRCIREFLQASSPLRRAVVAEPTGCEAVLCHRGIASWQARFHGRAGHSSAARALQDSALHQAARWMHGALDWAETQQREARFDDLAGVCFNVGTVAGGVKNNVIAPAAELSFGMRPLPGQDEDVLISTLQSLHEGAHAVDWSRRYHGPALPGGESLRRAGSFGAAVDEAAALAAELALPVGRAVDFWTEASLFSAAGIPAVVFGPGDIAQAHTADEWVSLAQLETALGHYLRIFGGAAADPDTSDAASAAAAARRSTHTG